MALIQLSSVVSAASGPIGGVLFRHGKGGAIAQAMPRKSSTESPYWLTRKDYLSKAAIAWHGLSQNNKWDWSHRAKLITVRNPLGINRPLTGRQLFIRDAVYNQQAGLAISETVPPSDFIQYFSGIELDVTVSSYELDLLNMSTDVYSYVHIYAARSTSTAGFVRPEPKFLYSQLYVIGYMVDFTAAFKSRLGEIQTGEVVKLKVFFTNPNYMKSNEITRIFTFPQVD